MKTVFRQAVREDIPVIEELFREMLRSVSGSADENSRFRMAKQLQR